MGVIEDWRSRGGTSKQLQGDALLCPCSKMVKICLKWWFLCATSHVCDKLPPLVSSELFMAFLCTYFFLEDTTEKIKPTLQELLHVWILHRLRIHVISVLTFHIKDVKGFQVYCRSRTIVFFSSVLPWTFLISQEYEDPFFLCRMHRTNWKSGVSLLTETCSSVSAVWK